MTSKCCFSFTCEDGQVFTAIAQAFGSLQSSLSLSLSLSLEGRRGEVHIERLIFISFIENIAKVKGMLEENQAHIIVLLKLVQQELENWPPQAFWDSCTGE